MNKQILIIDDEESIINSYLMVLNPTEADPPLFGETSEQNRTAYKLITALHGKEGVEKVKAARDRGYPIALAFVDSGWDGLETARMIREADPDIEIVIVTACYEKDRGEISEKVGTPEKLLCLKKPFDPEEIRQLALSLTIKWNLEDKNRKYREYMERLMGSVRKLKAFGVSSMRDALAAVLNETLNFVDSRKGFIARPDCDRSLVEISSEDLLPEETDSLVEKVSPRLSDIEHISQIGNIMIFPLKHGAGNLFIVVSDIDSPIQDEKLELLKILLETSSETLENVRIQEHFLRNQKIATIGRIATGIIHEIGNPLMAITEAAARFELDGQWMWNLFNICSEILEYNELPPDIREHLNRLNHQIDPVKLHRKMTGYQSVIRNGTGRIRGLMKNIRSFSGGGESRDMGYCDVREALEDTLTLAHNTLKYGINVRKEWEGPLMIRCDINGLKQVFLNLILNAVQAMEGTGELCISGKKENGKLFLSVKDSGPGIPATEADQIFDAFYTTKKDGTGLGLSIVKGVIEKHNGTIRMESESGKGTCFYIEIPECRN